MASVTLKDASGAVIVIPLSFNNGNNVTGLTIQPVIIIYMIQVPEAGWILVAFRHGRKINLRCS